MDLKAFLTSPEIISAVVTILGSALFGFLTTWFAFVLGQKRKVIEYNTFSASADKSGLIDLLEKRGIDKASIKVDRLLKKAKDFCVSEVVLQNIGNEAAFDLNIEIRLAESAEILDFEMHPGIRPGYKGKAQKDGRRSNILRAVIPFINRGEAVWFSVSSTGNESEICLVNVFGADIEQRSSSQSRRSYLFRLALIIFILGLSAGIFGESQGYTISCVLYGAGCPPLKQALLALSPYCIVVLIVFVSILLRSKSPIFRE